MQKINTSHTTALNDKKEEQENKPITLNVSYDLPNGEQLFKLVTIEHPTKNPIYQRRLSAAKCQQFQPK
jgi:hypothetical protein